MFRLVLPLIGFLLIASPSFLSAQNIDWTRVEMIVSAAKAPVPALRWELLPPARERKPGNRAFGYMKTLALPPQEIKTNDLETLDEKLTRLANMPVDRLPVKEAAEVLSNYRDSLRMLEDAARNAQCDWHEDKQPDRQDLEDQTIARMRKLILLVKLRGKLELVQGRPSESLRMLQIGFRLGKDLGEASGLSKMVAAIGLLHQTLDDAEEVIRKPHGPNLYWAFTSLPDPLIDPRQAFEGEANFISGTMPKFHELESGPVDEAKALEIYRGAVPALKAMSTVLGGSPIDFEVERPFGADAKKDLTQRGWPEKDVAAMSETQAAILRSVALGREQWDERGKLFFLPFHQALTESAKLRRRTSELNVNYADDRLYKLAAVQNETLEKVHYSHARLGRRIALLRAVEAVRMHVAANEGNLPKTLSDISIVPIPADPFTGKPFEYRADENKFILFAPPPNGDKPNPSNSMEYFVTLRKE